MDNDFETENLEEISYDHVERILDNRRRRMDEKLFRSHQNSIAIKAVLTALCCVILIYFILPISHIHTIRITGQHFLTDTYIKEIAGISESDRFYLTIPSIVKSRLESNPLIASAEVTMADDQTISISVVENEMIGYRYIDKPEVVLKDGSVVALESAYLDLVAMIPLIKGFEDEEKLNKLVTAFQDVDQEVIEDIAEIREYSLSYDPGTILVLMRTGGYFIGSYYSMANINSYNEVYALQSDKSQCLFSLEGQAKISSQTCPWNIVEEEYWTDAQGNYVLNESGEKVVKHYYSDASGNDALDSAGNKIAIPIDEKGNEVRDADFLAHYEAGYYATGSLVIPAES